MSNSNTNYRFHHEIFFFRKFPNLFLDTTPCGIYYKSLDDRTLILTFVGADFPEVIKAMM